MPPPSSSQAATAKKRQSSIMFAKGTKPDRSQTSNRNNRDSVAWGGLGNLAAASDSDSSDDDRPPRAQAQPAASTFPSASANRQQASANNVRQSWTSRAVAVGDRPPDSASQNPRSLKLLALKSAREGGQRYGGASATPSAGSSAPSTSRSPGATIPTPTYDRSIPETSQSLQQGSRGPSQIQPQQSQSSSSRPTEQPQSRSQASVAPSPQAPVAPSPPTSNAPTARQIQIQQQRDEAARRAKQQIQESKEKVARAEATKATPRPALPDAEKAQRIREQREEAARRVKQQYEEAKAKSGRNPSPSRGPVTAASSSPSPAVPSKSASVAEKQVVADPLSAGASSASRVETRAPIQRGYVDRTSRHGSTINFVGAAAAASKNADPLGSDGFGDGGKVWSDRGMGSAQSSSTAQPQSSSGNASVPRVLMPAPGSQSTGGASADKPPPSPLTAVATQLQAGLQLQPQQPSERLSPPTQPQRGPQQQALSRGNAGPPALGPSAQQQPPQAQMRNGMPPQQQASQQWQSSPQAGPQRVQGQPSGPAGPQRTQAPNPGPQPRNNGPPAALQPGGGRPQDRSPPQNAVRNPSPLNPNRAGEAPRGQSGGRTAGSGPSPPQSAVINARGPYERNGSPTFRQGGPPQRPGQGPQAPGLSVNGAPIQGDMRGAPSPQPRPGPSPGPSFSDSNPPYQQKQPSMFRRSMMFLGGGGGGGYEAAARSGDQGPPRQNAWRRSMAFMTGGPRPPPSQPYREEEKPVRVQGFAGEKEANRKSAYLGGGAAGDEWDYEGSGNNFWRRFSAAQRHAQNPNDGMEQTSRSYLRRIASGRRRAKCLTALAGIIIIAGIVGVVVWRSSQANADSSVPGTIDSAPGGQIQMKRAGWLGESVLPLEWAADEEEAGTTPPPAARPAASSNDSVRQRTRRHHKMQQRDREARSLGAGPAEKEGLS